MDVEFSGYDGLDLKKDRTPAIEADEPSQSELHNATVVLILFAPFDVADVIPRRDDMTSAVALAATMIVDRSTCLLSDFCCGQPPPSAPPAAPSKVAAHIGCRISCLR
jgi:hypothetical protein